MGLTCNTESKGSSVLGVESSIILKIENNLNWIDLQYSSPYITAFFETLRKPTFYMRTRAGRPVTTINLIVIATITFEVPVMYYLLLYFRFTLSSADIYYNFFHKS